MGLQKKLNQNDEAVSGWLVILVIIVIVILMFQYIIPLLSPTTPSISDLILPDNENANYDLYWRDKVTGQSTTISPGWNSDSNILDYSDLREYQIMLDTNHFYTFGEQFKLVIHAQSHNFVDNGDIDNWDTWTYSVNGIGYSTWLTDTFRFDIPTDTDFSLWIKCDLYSDEGIVIKQWDIRIPELDNVPVTYTADTWETALDIGGVVYWNTIWEL